MPAIASFPQTTLCLRNLKRQNRVKPAFKLCEVLECPDESHLKNQNNYLGETDDQMKELDWLSYISIANVCKFNKEDWLQIYDIFFTSVQTNYKI